MLASFVVISFLAAAAAAFWIPWWALATVSASGSRYRRRRVSARARLD